MIKCPHCYRTVPDGVLKCPHCHGNIVIRRVNTVGTPARRKSRIPAVAIFGVLAVLVLAGGLWLAWPSLQALLSRRTPPAPTQPAQPADTAEPGSAPAATATTSGLPTPRPPQGWKQIGGAQEQFVLWVPDAWKTYQAGIDFPEEWRMLMLGLDPRLADYMATAEAGALLGDSTTRAIALHSPEGIAESQFWPDTVYIRTRDDLAGRPPAEVKAEIEAQVNETYGTRSLKIISSNLPTLGSGPACKVEFNWSRTTPVGTEVKIHAVILVVFGDQSAFEMRMESGESSYNVAHAQAYQKMISSFRFSAPVAEAPLEMPAGWHEVRSGTAGFAVWVPDDWLAYNADTDNYQDWSQRVAESYVRGGLYLNGYSGEFEQAAFVALEPIERKNNTILLGTIQVGAEPDFAGMSSGTLAEMLRMVMAPGNDADWHLIQSVARWQHGRPAAYAEATLRAQPDPASEAAVVHMQILVLTDSPGPLVLQLMCADSQYEEFKATFDMVLKSFKMAQ